MNTKNKKLLNKKANKEYYTKSDGQFINMQYATKAHLILPRIAWARKWVHELGSRYHMDIGCKDGYFPLTLAAEGVECVGVDPSKDAIEEAHLRASEFDLENVSFINSTLEDLPVKFRFGSVSMLEVIEHVINPEEVITKLAKMGDFVLISTPDINGRHGLKDSEQNEEHVRLYSQEELENLINAHCGTIIESVVQDDQILIIARSLVA